MTQKHEPTMPAPPERNAPYATQFESLMDYLHRMVCSNARTIALPIQPDAFAEGRIEWSNEYVTTDFTRKAVYAALSAASDNAVADGPKAIASLPNGKSKAGAQRILVERYTPTRGKNKGVQVRALLQGLSAHRRANKRRAAADALTAAVAAGKAYTAEGVIHTTGEKEGELRIYATKDAAIKSWVRMVHGEDWWCDKAAKAERLEEGAKRVSLLE